MKPKERIEEAFKSLVRSRPCSKVTIADICREAHVSRRTFYTNFANKEAIVTSILDNTVIRTMRNFNSLFSMKEALDLTLNLCENMNRCFADDIEFYRGLIEESVAHDMFNRAVSQIFYDYNLEVLRLVKFDGSQTEVHFVAYYYATAKTMLLREWILDGTPLTSRELATLELKTGCVFWHNCLPESRLH